MFAGLTTKPAAARSFSFDWVPDSVTHEERAAAIKSSPPMLTEIELILGRLEFTFDMLTLLVWCCRCEHALQDGLGVIIRKVLPHIPWYRSLGA